MITGNKVRLQTALRWLNRFGQAGRQTADGRPITDPAQLARLQISPGGWPVSRDALYAQMLARLAGKTEPNQVETSYCGPAAFLYCLLEDRPDLYVAYVKALWSGRIFQFASGSDHMELEASGGAIKSLAVLDRVKGAARARNISDLDWMTMSSLSASTRPASGLWGAPKPGDQAGSISYPWVVRQWFAAVGSRPLADTMSMGITKKPLADFLKVARFWSSCWIVLQIDSSLLSGGGTNTFTQRHWVVMDPHHAPLVRMGAAGKVVQLGDLPGKIGEKLDDLDGSDEERVMRSWVTNLRLVSWGKENYAMATQTLGHLEGRLYGAFAFPRFR